jgi:sugar phosphate isomerase/epimerase
MFSKMLQQLSIAEATGAMKRIGFEGVDLTVREKGHVLPENVVVELPGAVEAIQSQDMCVGMLSTGVTCVEDPFAEETFKMAGECGVKLLKLGYWQYGGFGTLRASIDEIRGKLKDIEAMAKQYGVTATIHTHSGNFVTASLPICATLTEGLDPDAVGIYVDAGHIFIEGGYGVWKQGIDLVQDQIRLIAAKTFGWFPVNGNNGSAVKWTRKALSFDKGMTEWTELFGYMKQIGYDGYVSLHSEYNDLDLDALLAQTEKDLSFLKATIAELD